MQGNTIICNADARGRRYEGTIGQAGMYPGIKVVVQSATPLLPGGRPTVVPFGPTLSNPSVADSDPRLVMILQDDPNQGFVPGVAYANGTRCFLYCPLPGDELNVIVTSEAGTGSANAFFVGDRLGAISGTGQYKKGLLSATKADFMCLEHIDTTVGSPTLVYSQFQ